MGRSETTLREAELARSYEAELAALRAENARLREAAMRDQKAIEAVLSEFCEWEQTAGVDTVETLPECLRRCLSRLKAINAAQGELVEALEWRESLPAVYFWIMQRDHLASLDGATLCDCYRRAIFDISCIMRTADTERAAARAKLAALEGQNHD